MSLSCETGPFPNTVLPEAAGLAHSCAGGPQQFGAGPARRCRDLSVPFRAEQGRAVWFPVVWRGQRVVERTKSGVG